MRRMDIRIGPEYDKLIFVDGYSALIMGAVIVIKSNIDWVKFYLFPTEELAKRYDITKEMLDDNLCLEREYPKDMIVILNEDDPSRKAKFCFLNFNGQETPTTQKFRGIVDEKKQIMELKKENNRLMAKNAWLEEQYYIASTNVIKYVKNNVGAFADVFAPMIRSMQSAEEEATKATGKGT